MEQYISKSTLLAEIEKGKRMCDNHHSDYWNGCYNTFIDILSFIDTLEVKEVDLEKNISDWLFEGLPNEDELIDYIKETAKHFFELGIAVSNKA